jgi:acyl dehydratase
MLPNKIEIAARAPQVRHLSEIRATDFQRYAVAVGDLNPVYFDDQAARAAGHPGIVAPPNYLTSVRNWGAGPIEADLQDDGTETENLPNELMGMRLMGGGHELALGQPVRPGDIVTAKRRLLEIYERESKTGLLVFAVYEIVYLNQHDVHLATCRETIIAAK